jgi:hypothetical protein
MMANRSVGKWVFAVVAVVCGLLYWHYRDWWAYVDYPEGPMRKFIMPWWWQLLESSVVGAVAGGIAASVWWIVRHA